MQMYGDVSSSSSDEDPILAAMTASERSDVTNSVRGGLTMLSPQSLANASEDQLHESVRTPHDVTPRAAQQVLSVANDVAPSHEIRAKHEASVRPSMFASQVSARDVGRVVTVAAVTEGRSFMIEHEKPEAKRKPEVKTLLTPLHVTSAPKEDVEVKGKGEGGVSSRNEEGESQQVDTGRSLPKVDAKRSMLVADSNRRVNVQPGESSKSSRKTDEVTSSRSHASKTKDSTTAAKTVQSQKRPAPAAPKRLHVEASSARSRESRARQRSAGSRTCLVSAREVASKNYEAKGASSRSQVVALPKLVSDDDYDLFARAPAGRSSEMNAMAWTRHAAPTSKQSKTAKPDATAAKKKPPPDRRTNNTEHGLVFKEILQSMLINTTDGSQLVNHPRRERTLSPVKAVVHGSGLTQTSSVLPKFTKPNYETLQCTKM